MKNDEPNTKNMLKSWLKNKNILQSPKKHPNSKNNFPLNK